MMLKTIKLKVLLCFCWMLCIPHLLWAITYKIERKCYQNDAYGFTTYGIKGNASGGKAEIRMYFKNEYRQPTYASLIYAADLTTNSLNNFVAQSYKIHITQAAICNTALMKVFLCPVGSGVDEQSVDYDARLNEAFNLTIPDDATFTYFANNTIDVIIELELTGNVSLGDINEINLPGVTTLKAVDFVPKDYASAHYCSSNGSNLLCQNLNKVRSIPNTALKADVVIQAHRGVWGEVYNENSIGAMQKAKTDGIFLLESDIMPYGVGDTTNSSASNFAVPAGLVCFHDYFLDRYTDTKGKIYAMNRSQLQNVKLFKPRSTTISDQNLLFYDDLVKYVGDNDMFLCVDMKNLEPKGSGATCTRLCAFDDANAKTKSLMLDLKKGIEIASNINGTNYLKNIAIKTYEAYDDIRHQLVDIYGLSASLFDQILWAPMIAPNNKWKNTNNTGYDAKKIQLWLDGWMAHNETVLYYETNFFTDNDQETAVMLTNIFCYYDASGAQQCATAMDYIYALSGRRSGIFSEEPVGSKGTVNRWGTWKMKNPDIDRRGDHIWLISKPKMNFGVITTERTDLWQQLNQQ